MSAIPMRSSVSIILEAVCDEEIKEVVLERLCYRAENEKTEIKNFLNFTANRRLITMNLIYAALFLHSAGKEVNEENLKKVVGAVDESVDEAQIKALVAALSNVNIDEAIKKAVAMPAAAAPQPPAQAAEEEKKEEKKEEEAEKKAEKAAEGLSALFG